MSVNKIRLRNLDDEVLKYFRKVTDRIGYDQLNSDVVTQIKNSGGSSSGTVYNDSELRNRLINVENTMLSKTAAASIYAAKKDYDTTAVVNTKIDQAKANINSSITNLDNKYIKKENGSVVESYLSQELINKINAHTQSSSSNTDDSVAIGELKIQTNRNASEITSIKNTLDTRVFMKDDPISIDNLDEDLQVMINNARSVNTLIGIDDLDAVVRRKLDDKTTAVTQNIIDTMARNGDDGQTLIINKVSGQADTYSVTPKHIVLRDIFVFKMDKTYLDNTIVIKSTDKDDPDEDRTFDSAKTYAQNNGYTYIADVNRNVLLTRNTSNNTWTEEKPSAEKIYEKLIGCFVFSYPDGAFYYCRKKSGNEFKYNTIEIFNPEDYVRQLDIDQTIEYFDELETRVEALEKSLKTIQSQVLDNLKEVLSRKLDLESLIDMESTSQPSNAKTGSFWIDPGNTAYIKTDSGWEKVEQA